MAEGARHATGEWLLFTDADVVLAPDALKRAMAFALRHGLGHVVAFPHFVAPGFLERAFVTAFAVFATLKFRVWDLHRPGTAAYVGVGAFNLVRRPDYDGVGGHGALAHGGPRRREAGPRAAAQRRAAGRLRLWRPRSRPLAGRASVPRSVVS